MAKGKTKNNSKDALAPTHPQSLRSRKRECPKGDVSLTDDVQATLHHQYTEEEKTALITTQLECPHSLLQECSVIIKQQDQVTEEICNAKQGDSTEEKNPFLGNVTVKDSEGQEEHTVTYPNNESQLEKSLHMENDTNKSGKEEIASQETHADQQQLFFLVSESGVQSCATALEDQPGADDNSQCSLERNHKTSQDESSSMCMCDAKEVTQESAAGFPAKKKRRMGMCGLTETERSHFLLAQKRENRQNVTERVEKQISNNTADRVSQETIISSPPSITVGRVREQSEAETKLQSSCCGEESRPDNEVCFSVSTLDGTSTMCDPGYSEENGCEAEGGIESGPKQTGEPKPNPPAEEKVETHLGNLDQQEHERRTHETHDKQSKDGSADAECSAAINFYTDLPQNEGIEKKKDGSKADALQGLNATRARDERNEEIMGDAGNEAEAGSGCLSCGSVEHCEAAMTPGGSNRKDSSDPDVGPAVGPSTVNSEQMQTKDTTDLFGSGYLDFVSDSQLNSIVLTKEEIEQQEDPSFSVCHEDATDLVCGLIRELSSLNQKVLATHRELENLRRGNKTARSSIR